MTQAYPLPAEALDDRLAFVGTAGAGKTYSAGTAVEKLLHAGARVVIIDPLDVWWGLRLAPDGKGAGFNPVIFGGKQADLPLTEQAGTLIGEAVATMAESCIVSLGALPSKAAEQRFMLAFLEALYRNTAGDPVHVVFDEADLWAPQNASKEGGNGPRLQALMEQIVRRGRIKGFVPWLITQRPAVISKDVLSQADGLVAFKLTSSQDRAAIGAWVKSQADEGQWSTIDAALPSMQRGQGIVWLPGHGILETAQFPTKATFDSSRTPKRGEKVERRDLKPLNLEALQGKLAAIEEEVKASDPRALKAEVVRLTRELVKAQRSTAAPPAPERIVANADEIDAARKEGERIGIAIGITRARQAIDALRVDGAASAALVVSPGRSGKSKPIAHVEREAQVPPNPAPGVTGPGQRILNALAWWQAFGIEQPSNEQVAFIASYSATSTGYTNPRSALRIAGLIEYLSGGSVTLTASGAEKAEAPATPPTAEELRRRVLARLSGPQQRILTPLIEAYPGSLTNAEAAERAGYSASSTGYTNPRSSLRTLSLIEYLRSGEVRASDWLFPSSPALAGDRS